MSDKHVVGIKYTDQNGKDLTFYIQQDYNAKFTKWIAWAIRDASMGWGIEKSMFFSRFVAEFMANSPTSRIFPSVPANGHTLHLVDIDTGKIALLSADGSTYKVSYTFEDFYKRVKA